MNAKDWESKLHQEGFSNFFVWRDGPNAYYPDHTHLTTTAHVILEGEMTLTTSGKTQTFKAGDRCDVPAHAVHSARMGPQGCKYLIGKKQPSGFSPRQQNIKSFLAHLLFPVMSTHESAEVRIGS